MKWYGSVQNRIEENKQFCPTIEVGTGVTEYLYTDRTPYEVVEVKSQKDVFIRRLGHKPAPDMQPYENKWEYYSIEDYPAIEVVKRGNYWYTKVTCTPDEAREILNGENNIDDRLWACNNDFNLQEIAASGKTKTRYHRRNLSFGKAEYYYCYEL